MEMRAIGMKERSQNDLLPKITKGGNGYGTVCG